MSNAGHFSHCLQKYPDCRDSLAVICTVWKRYGRLPAHIRLRRNALSIEPQLLELFGAGALQLSKNGTVTLVTGRLFASGAAEEQEQWLHDVHEACGIPFVKNAAEGGEDAHALALQKWRLMFPDLGEIAEVIPVSRGGHGGAQEQLDKWITAGRIVSFLMHNTEPLTVSDLGARFCGDSKMLRGGELITLVADWLVFMDTGMQMNTGTVDAAFRKSVRRQALEGHGVVENRCSVAVTVFGPLVFEKNGKRMSHVMDRWEENEAAVLSLENLDNITAVRLPAACRIYTCENESPFANLIRKKHPGVLIYTRGFPNSAVCRVYRLLATHFPDAMRLHWGDTDLAGLQIAAILHDIAPLRLWRCDLDTVTGHGSDLIPVDRKERERIERFLENNPDFPFSDVLAFTSRNGWLEQERMREEDRREND